MTREEIMNMAIQKAMTTSLEGIGGPFGAAIVKDGEIICVVSNTVLRDKDPTAHAEINAIREACRILGTHDLSGCEIYATGAPCPMCMSAIIWANIKTVYYCNDGDAAENIGFRDEFIYNYIRGGCTDGSVMHIYRVTTGRGQELYDTYAANKKQIY